MLQQINIQRINNSSMHQFSFEKLIVWHDARSLVKEVYLLTETYPKSELFGLVNQLRRAAVSVSSNIAEGSSRTSGKDQAHFYQISFSSLMEVLSQLILSLDLGYLDEKLLNEKFRPLIEKLANQINALRKSINNRLIV